MPTWAFAGLAAAGLAGSWLDFTRRRLPNWLCLVALIAGLAVAVVSGGMAALGAHSLHAFVALLVGMLLFALRVIGGGDAKFYAALAAWFPFAEGLRLFVSVALAGAVLTLFFIAYRKAKGRPAFPKDPDLDERLPYGIAIATGALLLAGMGSARLF
jgi:prepilin peptidase CpaA